MASNQQALLMYGAAGAYQVANSLRFRSSASAYLSRVITLSSVWTLSVWVKRGALGVTSPILGGSVLFNSNDTLTAGTLTTTAVYRDPSAWYHIVINNSNVYVNGASIGSTTTGILANPNIGNYLTSYFDGYLADINLIDGQSVAPTAFGQYSSTTGVWIPARYTGTYGTNGFKLNFSNGTSTTTLGYDSSGNSNNWTTNNISLTAGSTYDWMIDSPTSFAGTSYGVGNYAVLNTLIGYSNASAGVVLSNANLNITGGSSTDDWRPSTISIASGKWYFETTVITVGAISMVGINNVLLQPNGNYPGVSSLGYIYLSSGNKMNNNSSVAYGASYTNGDVIGTAFDADAGTLTFYKNNVSQGVAYSSIPAGSYCFNVYGRNNGGANNCAANFGQRPFAYTPPSGYKSLCTYNLPTPSILAGNKYMDATTYTGNGATQSITNSGGMQPDFVWVKSRSAATDHKLTDIVRGVTKALVSDSTAAETTDTNGLTAFNGNGFTVGSDTVYNNNAATYIGWQWKAGGTAVTNTAGSITSQVSANTTAGFSVVTYTGNGSTGTVGHGVSVAPSFIIVKSRSSGTDNWQVYSSVLGNTQRLRLNTTDAADSPSPGMWNSTSPTSTVFSVGNQSGVNASGYTYVAYCFAAIAGYSAFGSYTGNGSADGPFVYCGFRPRFVLLKCSSASGTSSNWIIQDTARDTYNAMPDILLPNLSNAEISDPASTGYVIDCLSNGFKIRNTNNNWNASGGTYIYAAFAENPFNNALAR